MKLLRTIYNKRLAQLDSLAQMYQEQGFETKVDGVEHVLYVYGDLSRLEEL